MAFIKIYSKLFFLILPYILFISLSFTNPWFIFIPKIYYISLNIVFLIFTVLVYLFLKNKKDFTVPKIFQKYFPILLVLISGIFIALFPIQNLNLGDGIILLENLALEAKTYGYQIILDELWEGLSHSYLFIKFNFEDPRTIYKYISSLCGGILFFTFLINFQKIFKQNLFTFPLLLGNAGILLFYGYFENYTITTLYIFLNSFVVYWIIYNNKKGIKPLLILAALAAIGCIFHLVFAYTFFSLVYLAFILSDKKDFIKNSIFSAILAGLILGITFGYFLFFSDLRIDPAQGHATNPKFYPIRKWISIGHFKEIFSCMFFNSASSLYAIFYFYFFEKTFFKEFFKSRFGKFLLFLLLGFLLHGFVHDPQLGFPADWDLMGFYWIPLSLISIFMIRDFDFRKSFFLFPFFIFNFILIQFTSFELNKPLPKKEKEVKELLSQINNFNNKYSDKKEIILPEHRKFHVRTLFFLYRTHEKLKQNSPESKELLETNEILEKEFISRYPNYDKIWKKDFLTRATKYHEDYLEFIKNK